jgi:hypothetical protein
VIDQDARHDRIAKMKDALGQLSFPKLEGDAAYKQGRCDLGKFEQAVQSEPPKDWIGLTASDGKNRERKSEVKQAERRVQHDCRVHPMSERWIDSVQNHRFPISFPLRIEYRHKGMPV